ncbi:MAG: methyl-accepting chemotaxis protein, partial [Rhodospirillaceae bacterium]
MANVGFFERYRVGTRINSGFAVVLALLVAVAVVAVINLRHGADGLRDYARVAANTIETVGVAADVAEMRRRVVLFADSGDEAALARARALITSIGDTLDALIARTKAADRRQMLTELRELVSRYGAGLGQAVSLRAEREQMITQTMDTIGTALNAGITEVVTRALAEGNTALAAQAGVAQNAFAMARYWAARFTAKAEPRFADSAAEQITLFRKTVAGLQAQVTGSEIRTLLTAAASAAAAYQQRFGEARTLTRTFDETVFGTLAGLGTEFAEKAARLRDAQIARNTGLLAQTDDAVTAAVTVSVALSLAALLIGLLCARVISGSIIRPVEGVRKVMVDLAEGHLEVSVPYTGGRDELAEMARAVNTFKDVSTVAVRAGCGLDQVTANVMMTDTTGDITSVNPALVRMFRAAENDLRAVAPDFDAGALTGLPYRHLPGQSEAQQRTLAALTATLTDEMRIGRRTFRVTANPVVSRRGVRLGAVLEWRDLTEELAIEAEIKAIVEGALHGDLSRRITLEGKTGFFRAISEGINGIALTVSEVSEELAAALSTLANGDLSQRIDKRYEGVFLRLKDDYNATAVKLAEVVGRITQATQAMSNASAEVSAGSADLADRTEQQASNLEETAAAMEELGATTRSNADNALEANRMAGKAKQAAEHGGQLAEQAVTSIKRIEQASRKITEIIGVIDEIAFQTNLLALNAAVEAARAGDAGKGFAVVAQEVRVLAQRSAQASKEIKLLITASDTQVHDGVEMVQKAGSALGGIVSGVNQVAAMIEEMATASAEQASAIDEINSAVAQLDEMTQKNAALVEETTAAAQS